MMASTGKLYWFGCGVIFAHGGADNVAIPITTRLGGVERAEDLAVFFDDMSTKLDGPAREHVLSCVRQLRRAIREARAYALRHHPVLKHWPGDSLVGRVRDAEVRP